MENFNDRKIVQSLNYLASKSPGGKLNKMKAYKLLWLADRYHLRHYARTITSDVYYALKFGPVPTKAKDILDENKICGNSNEYLETVKEDKYFYKSKESVNLKVFSETDLEVLDLIWNTYGKYDQNQLFKLSHEFPEWKRFEEKLAINNTSYKMVMEDFFENYDDGHGLFENDDELIQITKEMWSEMS